MTELYTSHVTEDLQIPSDQLHIRVYVALVITMAIWGM